MIYVARRLVSARRVVTDTLLAHFHANSGHRGKMRFGMTDGLMDGLTDGRTERRRERRTDRRTHPLIELRSQQKTRSGPTNLWAQDTDGRTYSPVDIRGRISR